MCFGWSLCSPGQFFIDFSWITLAGESARKSWAVQCACLAPWIPPLWRLWGHHSEACLLSATRAAAAFLPLSFLRQRKTRWCLCVLQMRRMLSRQVILWLKVDGGAQLIGKRGQGSICPLVCFNSFRLEYRICWVRGEPKLRNAVQAVVRFCLVCQPVWGTEAGGGRQERDTQLVVSVIKFLVIS